MFGIDNYPGFVLAAVILNLTPGADTFYILTRSVSQGARAGLVSVAGIISGCVVHVFLAAFGLSLVLATSVRVFAFVKWAGAAYLIYLGIKTLLEKQSRFSNHADRENSGSLLKIYRQGVLTNVLNPKVALFFLSFLPQFINPAYADGPVPFLFLGGTFVLTGTIWCLILSWTAAAMTHTMRRHPVIGDLLQKISGLVFIGFGVKLALQKQ